MSQSQRQPSDEFSRFQCFPAELQVTIFETALADSIKPRIAILGVEKTPVFTNTRWREVILGWQLKIKNSAELDKENVLELAQSLLQTCKIGECVAGRFIGSHRVWDRPRHCKELLSHDLSLSEDVFWLPDDLFDLYWEMGFSRAGKDDWRDEQRIACLMVSLEALQQVTRWAMGLFNDQEYRDEADGYVCLDNFRSTLRHVIHQYPSCEEIIVVVGTPVGDRKHISWSDLNYIEPNDEQMFSKFDLYAADRDEADQCRGLFQKYHILGDDGPGLSFAFKKRRELCAPPSPIPESAVSVRCGSQKRTHDEYDEAADSEMPAKKRQRI